VQYIALSSVKFVASCGINARNSRKKKVEILHILPSVYFFIYPRSSTLKEINSVAFSPQVNYTD
jgi:hypothetical protein